MPNIAFSIDCLKAYAALPKGIQGKVSNFFNKFQADPTASGFNFEKINTPYDEKVFSVRIDDTYRGIVTLISETNSYVMLWVDHHDEAYQWAQNKKVKINPSTGVLQVYTVIAGEISAPMPEVSSLFGAYSNKELLKIGVPEELLSYVKQLPDQSSFYAAEEKLPKDAYENLEWLVNDIPIEEVIALYESQLEGSEDEPRTNDPLKNPVAMKSFVVVEGEDELRRVLAEPLENWRVFLHPSQRKLVKKNFNGPARVLGGAGTGKTVVAMHRAKWLLGQIPENQQVLFTTYTANLAADIKEQLRKICTPAEWKRIEVIHLDAWMMRFLKNRGFHYDVFSEDLKETWQKAIDLSGEDVGFSIDFFEDEWIKVVCAQDAFSKEDYLKASRIGRGTRLNRAKRIQVWAVFEEYMTLMKEQKRRDSEWAKYECRCVIQQRNEKLNYGAIVVDEAQDMSSEAFRLLRAIIGEQHKNDIFIVGDTHQRIYKNYAVLSKCGIDVKGRGSYLRINYRTTEEIRKYAFSLLKGLPFEDLDGDTYDSGKKCQSLTHGEMPDIRNFKTQSAEAEYIVSEIHKLLVQGMAPGDICVTARTNRLRDAYQQLLNDSGIETYEIKTEKQDDRYYGGVRLATMHRVKGLEFAAVFVAGSNSGILPLAVAIDHTDETSEEESLKAERCLLYVALTRARNYAYITSFGTPSEFITVD